MKIRDYLYIFGMILFFVLAYLLFDRGFNVRTKNAVNYQTQSDISYKVYLRANDDFNGRYQKMNERYLTELVDDIIFDFDYSKIFGKDASGYYSYEVVGLLHAYVDDINDDVWTKEYRLIDNKTMVINQNNVKSIDVSDRAIVDFDGIKSDLDTFKERYKLALQGYLEVDFVFKDNLNFQGIDKVVGDEKKITAVIPLSYDTFKINVENNINNIDSYYDFSTHEKINYVLLIIGAFCLSMGISFLALVIREMVLSVDTKVQYARELRRILAEHDDIIVKIKRFYNKRKYNLIYVDSFSELMEVYNKIGNPISFKEVKKGEEALFIIIDDDSAWIYQLLAKKNK